MSPRKNSYLKLDWVIIICYLLLVAIGWINIFASVYSADTANLFDLTQRSGMHLLWIGISLFVAILLLFVISPKLYFGFAWLFYLIIILLLVAVLFFGTTVNGARSWFTIKHISFQPSEISKTTTAILLSVIMGKYGFKFSSALDFLKVMAILCVPIALIALQPDIGTILVYCSFIFMLYREGLSGWFLLFAALCILLFVLTLKFSPFVSVLVLIAILGIIKGIITKKTISNILIYGMIVTALAFIPRLLSIDFLEPLRVIKPEYYLLMICAPFVVYLLIKSIRKKQKALKYLLLCFICSVALIFSVQIVFEKLLKDHHRDRIENLLGITEDLQGVGYNVNQSKIAIGSGGFLGKGFLQGTQTKFRFVPEQSTDFIFCTIGEEWGFVGSFIMLSIFLILILRILGLAEKQKDHISRIYGYCVASIIFMHVFVNVGMTIGLMPVVGIPLPWISYGGSSFLSFTILLFIFVRLDFERKI